jgi:hypothetical protein
MWYCWWFANLCIFISCFFVLFWRDWGLNSGLHVCKVDSLLLESCLQSIFFLVILETGSWELFAQADLELCVILLISASQLARITSVSPWELAISCSFIFVLIFVFVWWVGWEFWDRVLLCSPGWLQACDPAVSTSWVLGLKACITLPLKESPTSPPSIQERDSIYPWELTLKACCTSRSLKLDLDSIPPFVLVNFKHFFCINHLLLDITECSYFHIQMLMGTLSIPSNTDWNSRCLHLCTRFLASSLMSSLILPQSHKLSSWKTSSVLLPQGLLHLLFLCLESSSADIHPHDSLLLSFRSSIQISPSWGWGLSWTWFLK